MCTALADCDADPFEGALIHRLWDPISCHNPSSEVMMIVSGDEGPPLSLCFANQTVFIAHSSGCRMVHWALFHIFQF